MFLAMFALAVIANFKRKAAKAFIAELNEDIKRINTNNTNRVNTATAAADRTLERMGQTLAIEQTSTVGAIDVKKDT